ncbi:MAG TPA: metal ABC transporter permease, partial [Pirellulales bacterium]
MIDFNNLAVYAGAGLLGAVAGLVGSFSVLRRRALASDALAHATLPGLCLAFLVIGSRNLPALLIGALCTGWLGVAAISALRRWTRIREDTAICVVLGVFFGAGIALSRSIENASGIGGKAGLDAFLLGNIGGMTHGELCLLAALTGVCLFLVVLL